MRSRTRVRAQPGAHPERPPPDTHAPRHAHVRSRSIRAHPQRRTHTHTRTAPTALPAARGAVPPKTGVFIFFLQFVLFFWGSFLTLGLFGSVPCGPSSPEDFSQLGSPGGGQASHQLGRGGRHLVLSPRVLCALRGCVLCLARAAGAAVRCTLHPAAHRGGSFMNPWRLRGLRLGVLLGVGRERA